jgi:hypothetical protein
MMKSVNVRKQRRLPVIGDVIRGSAVIMERTCGSESCRCMRGHKHRSLYISQYHKGSSRMVYIPKEFEKKVLRMVSNYRILRSAIHKASEANLGRFMAGVKKKP